ncbi:hypothetical protein QUF72_05435, partial [Desulfobacterales bacterium HSG2]|nr:hypothetical protein [Desulfobacterales bacterium HSG2]
HFCRQPATCHSSHLSFLRTQESTFADNQPPVIPAACHSCERRNPLLPPFSAARHPSHLPPVIPANAGIHFCRQPATCHSCHLSFLRTQESTFADNQPPVIPAACHSYRNPLLPTTAFFSHLSFLRTQESTFADNRIFHPPVTFANKRAVDSCFRRESCTSRL